MVSSSSHPGFVHAEWTGQDYPAQIDEQRWNGWASPRFTLETARRIVTDMMERPEDLGSETLEWVERDGSPAIRISHPYDPYADETPEPEFVEPDAEGLYALGAWAWVWQEVTPAAEPEEER